jgi:5-formyltetrahydrofolate cyclo-ligase
MKNWRQTVLSQFQSSPRLMPLLAAIEAWLSPDANYEAFYQNVQNIDTASGYGLDVWGRIVNIPRTVTLIGIPTFGFGEAGDRVGFGQGPFYEASIGVTQNFVLQDPIYRQLILAKAAYNITSGSTQAINAILMNLFRDRGNAWVTDGRNVMPASFGFGEAGDRFGFGQAPFGDLLYASLPDNMTLTYVFDFPLADFEKAIVQSGVLPKPTGVTPFWAFLRG